VTLLAPAWLAILLLAGPIVLLHARRRRRVVVSSLLLWRRVPAVAPTRQALERPPVNATMLLQLLALLLAALALARPAFAAPEHLIVLLDGGGESGGEGFAAAVSEAIRLVRAAPDGSVWSLVLVTERPRSLAARWPVATTSPADLDLVPGVGGGADWAAAAALARRLADDGALVGGAPGPRPVPRTVVLGAGASSLELVRRAVPDAEAGFAPGGAAAAFSGARVTPGPVSGDGADRAGAWRVTGGLLERLGDVALAGQPATAELSATLASPDGATRTGSVPVELALGGPGDHVVSGAFDLALDLAPEPPLDPALEPRPGATRTLELSVGGAVAAFVLHPEPAPLRVLYLGPAGAPVARALAALPHVVLERLSDSDALPADAAEYDLVVLDGAVVTAAPATSTWWLGAARLASAVEPRRVEEAGVEEVGAAGASALTWTAHPLVAAVDWPTLGLGAAWRAEQLPGAEVLLTGVAGALLQLRRLPTGLEVRLALDLTSGAWPDSPSFPLFVRDLLALVEPRAGARVEETCAVWVACALPAGTVGVTDPLGRPVPLGAAEHGGTLTVAGAFVPETAGLHLLTSGRGATRPLAVNAFTGSLEPPAAGARAGAAPQVMARTLLLALLSVVLVVEALLALRGGDRAARRGLALRGGALSLVALGLAGVRLPLPGHVGELVLVAPTDAAAGAWAEREGAPFVSLPAAARGEVAAAASIDLEGAVDLALALVPPATPARLVLASDGLETRGDVAAAMARARERGVGTEVLTWTASTPLDAALSAVHTPDLVLAGDRFTLHADLFLAGAGPEAGLPATVTTYREGAVLEEREVTLRPGHSRVSVEAVESAPGEFEYEMVVALPGDAVAGNDRFEARVRVGPAPSVLLVAEAGGWTERFGAALAAQGLAVTLVPPAAMPAEPEGFAGVSAAVLANVPAAALTTGQQSALEAAVRDQGLPLLLLGGEHAFGPGGYYETPLERLSPTSSLVPREAPELAIAFVLDRSNSMRQYAGDRVRLDVAKAAALSAHDVLPEGARSALIVFDSTARTLVPLGPAADDAAFRAAVLELDPRGGTNLYPALVAAYDELADSGAASAHVIVMSDGQSQPGDFEGILAALRERGVTVSAIAVGPEADAEQLREVARLGGGAFYASRDFSALPNIMTHEVLLRSGELTDERDTVPAWTGPRPAFLRAWPDALPEVSGYVPTSLKPGARLHLYVTDDEGETMPLLASWRHGAGEVVAFTAHGAGPWTADWLGLDPYAPMWGHLVRQLAAPPPAVAPALELTRDGEELLVVAPAAEVTLELPGGDTRRLSAREVAEGRFVAATRLVEPGVYRAGAGGAEALVTLPYPVGLDIARADPGRLAAAARAGGGDVLVGLDEALRPSAWRWRPAPAWPLAILATLLLLLTELTWRYAPDLLPRPTARRKDGRP